LPKTTVKQIVEVVGDAPGQLADGLHLLRLAEHLLDLLRSAISACTRCSSVWLSA
jgi:hypothetical protein